MATHRNDRPERSILITAAEAFDSELRRFGGLADAARKSQLSSQKDFERAGRAIQDIADSERELGLRAKELIDALGEARQLQETHAAIISTHIKLIEERSHAMQALTQRYGALGTDAGMLNRRVQELAADPRDGTPASNERVATILREVGAEMLGVGERARARSPKTPAPRGSASSINSPTACGSNSSPRVAS